MGITISVAVITHYGEWFHLPNMLGSLVPLKPNQICILDTTLLSNWKMVERSHSFIGCHAKAYGLPVTIKHKEWAGSYRDAKNIALDMCSCDWTWMIDSDEMIEGNTARFARQFIEAQPDHVLALRTRRLSLLDDTHCLDLGLWDGSMKGLGSHPKVVRTGCGRFEGPHVHEVFAYPGRKTIHFPSPEHPKRDFPGGYVLHLWVYKDNILRRCWGDGMPANSRPDEVGTTKLSVGFDLGDLGDYDADVWRRAQESFCRRRGYSVVEIPKSLDIQPIVWDVMPEQWTVSKHNGEWAYRDYRPYKGQAQR